MNRRFFLKGALLVPVAPAIVRAESLMKIAPVRHALVSGGLTYYFDAMDGYMTLDDWAHMIKDDKWGAAGQ